MLQHIRSTLINSWLFCLMFFRALQADQLSEEQIEGEGHEVVCSQIQRCSNRISFYRIQGSLCIIRQEQRRRHFAQRTADRHERAGAGHDASGSGGHDSGSGQRQCVTSACDVTFSKRCESGIIFQEMGRLTSRNSCTWWLLRWKTPTSRERFERPSTVLVQYLALFYRFNGIML